MPLPVLAGTPILNTAKAKRTLHHSPTKRGRTKASTANPVSIQNRNRPRWQPPLKDLTVNGFAPLVSPGLSEPARRRVTTACRVHEKVGEIVACPTRPYADNDAKILPLARRNQKEKTPTGTPITPTADQPNQQPSDDRQWPNHSCNFANRAGGSRADTWCAPPASLRSVTQVGENRLRACHIVDTYLGGC